MLEAPSNLGLMPPAPGREPSVSRLPEALAAAGLAARLTALWGGRVSPPPYSGRSLESGIRNAAAVAAFAVHLARSVSAVLDRGGFPLVLGGDCSILLGNLLALRRRGRYGLVFLDGHDDFSTPETSASHGAAGMDLALATGRGPQILANLEGVGPLVRDEDVLVVGARERSGRLPFRSLSVDALREANSQVGRELARTAAADTAGFWIHLDVDVLDPAVMPAVDSPEPGGLSLEELSEILRGLLGSGRAVGMHVAIYDPDRDSEGTAARGLVDLLAGAFSPPPAASSG
jgi:arginase